MVASMPDVLRYTHSWVPTSLDAAARPVRIPKAFGRERVTIRSVVAVGVRFAGHGIAAGHDALPAANGPDPLRQPWIGHGLSHGPAIGRHGTFPSTANGATADLDATGWSDTGAPRAAAA
jgi:hypothetical protein